MIRSSRLVVSAGLAVLLLSGCGSGSVRPGAAALVGEERITVDDLLADDDADDVVIRPQPCGDGGALWLLSRRDDPSGRVVAKQRVPEGNQRDPERHVHPGHDWFYVLSGTVRLVLGGKEHVVAEGQAAAFSTLTPHSVVGVGGTAEILTILDHHGERSHLDGH